MMGKHFGRQVASGFAKSLAGWLGKFSGYSTGTRRRLGADAMNIHRTMIVRGAESSDAQIVSAETYVNGKTGAY